MIELKSSYIDSLALNASAISNGKSLVGKFLKLCIAEDETLIFGECAGSGKKAYLCSVDFIDKNNPVTRCSCPSRQIPCKHALGLMYAYTAGKQFQSESIPEDILIKRGKIEKRLENKEKKLDEAKKKPSRGKLSKAKINSAEKKINAQLEGIATAELLLKNTLQTGIAGVDAIMVKNLEQQVKGLGNYYIGGIQNSFSEILINIKNNNEQEYDRTIESLLYMSALLKKAAASLESKKKDEDKILKLDISSAIEEQTGHIWKLEELLENNMYIENAQLIQLAFYSYVDHSRKEIVDQSFNFCLNDRNIYLTYNYRPFKALKYVKEEDSCYELMEISELYIYPGNINPRVRWNKYTMNDISREHIKKIKDSSKTEYSEVVKMVKNQIKSPLADKNPIALLNVADVSLIEANDKTTQFHIIDKSGVKQILQDKGYVDSPSVSLLEKLDKNLLIGNALLVMFTNDIESGILSAKPLSIVTDNQIIRLVY